MFDADKFVKSYKYGELFLTASYTACLQLGSVSLLRILGPVAFPRGFLCINLSQTQTGLAGFPLEDAALGWTMPSMQYNLKEFLQHMWIVLCLLQDNFREQNISERIFGKAMAKFWTRDRGASKSKK